MARPTFRGAFVEQDAAERGLALVTARVPPATLHALIDPESLVLYDARFFTYGAPATIAILDTFVEMAKGRTLDQVKEISPRDVELALRDSPGVPAIDGTETYLDLLPRIVSALEAGRSDGVALARVRDAARVQADGLTAAQRLCARETEFRALSVEEQRCRVEAVLDHDVRPGLAADGGGLVLVEVANGRDVVVSYVGTCGSCGISAGATLGFIEKTLRARLHDGLRVVPTNAYPGPASPPVSEISRKA
ncbi:MAG: NifU family protein [Planctomycetes bacterium]|nr:NifU family protein [Planctomycetota bacterium]